MQVNVCFREQKYHQILQCPGKRAGDDGHRTQREKVQEDRLSPALLVIPRPVNGSEKCAKEESHFFELVGGVWSHIGRTCDLIGSWLRCVLASRV